MTPNPNEIFSARVVVESPGGIVIVQRAATGEFQRAWELPGGKVNPGEPLSVAAIRETREEIGLDVDLLSDQPTPVEDRIITDGKHKGKVLHSFGFLAIADSEEIQLSPEHGRFRLLRQGDTLPSGTLTPTSYRTLRMLRPLMRNQLSF